MAAGRHAGHAGRLPPFVCDAQRQERQDSGRRDRSSGRAAIMMRTGMIGSLALAALMLFSLPGCQWEQIEELSIVYGIAYEPLKEPQNQDDSGETRMKATYIIPLYKKDGFDKVLIEVQGKTAEE